MRKDHPLELLVEPVPIHLPNVSSSVIGVACGRAHTIVLTEKDGAFSFGHNGYGQCGRPIIENEDYQKQSMAHRFRSDEKFVQVVCGQDHRFLPLKISIRERLFYYFLFIHFFNSLLINDKGSVYACGWSADGQTGVGHYNNTERLTKCIGDIAGEKIVKIACSADCVLALNGI